MRTGVTTAFRRLPPEKRELEEVRMALVRGAPELQAAARERSGLTVAAVADRIADAYGRDRTDLDVLLSAGIVTGARLAAQTLADRTGESYIDVLDRVMGRLEDGIPLGDLTLDGGTPRFDDLADPRSADTTGADTRPEQHRM